MRKLRFFFRKITLSTSKSTGRTFFRLAGLVALIWFLVRVIPKPSRAFYPCQRAAFPFAAGFIGWLIGAAGSLTLFRKGRSMFGSGKYIGALSFTVSAFLVLVLSMNIAPGGSVFAGNFAKKKGSLPELKERITAGRKVEQPETTVSLVKSTLANASEITFEDIKDMVELAVEYAGGLDDIIDDGDTVVLKPNLVYDKEQASGTLLFKEVNGITTDWRIVKAVSEIVRDLNPSGKILVMEGSAISTQYMFDRMNFNKTQMPEVDAFYALESTSGGWREYDAAELVAVNLTPENTLYPDNEKPYNSPEYYLNKIYYNADVLISLPLLKNHESASITGAVKNLSIGATPANIYGGSEVDNTRSTINHGTYMHEFIHDFYMCRPADFAIMDGLQGLEYGPTALTTSQTYAECKQNMRLILAGRDPVAVDAIEALLASYDPSKINYLVYLHNDNIGCADPTMIRVKGARVADERTDLKHNRSTEPKFVDDSPPDFTVGEARLEENGTLTILLDAYSNIDKMELTVDGTVQEEIVVSGFDSITFNVSGQMISDNSEIILTGYNIYLSYKDVTLAALVSGKPGTPYNMTIRTYPSVIEDRLFIEGVQREASLEVLDFHGRILKKENIFAGQSSVNLDELKQGLYIILVREARGIIHQTEIYKL